MVSYHTCCNEERRTAIRKIHTIRLEKASKSTWLSISDKQVVDQSIGSESSSKVSLEDETTVRTFRGKRSTAFVLVNLDGSTNQGSLSDSGREDSANQTSRKVEFRDTFASSGKDASGTSPTNGLNFLVAQSTSNKGEGGDSSFHDLVVIVSHDQDTIRRVYAMSAGFHNLGVNQLAVDELIKTTAAVRIVKEGKGNTSPGFRLDSSVIVCKPW